MMTYFWAFGVKPEKLQKIRETQKDMGKELNIGKLFDKLDTEACPCLDQCKKDHKNKEKDKAMVKTLEQMQAMQRKLVNLLTVVRIKNYV